MAEIKGKREVQVTLSLEEMEEMLAAFQIDTFQRIGAGVFPYDAALWLGNWLKSHQQPTIGQRLAKVWGAPFE